jgi:two-component system sensor histidine kinase/response regulator
VRTSAPVANDSPVRLNTPLLLIALFWTILIVALAGWGYQQSRAAELAAARAASRMSYDKDMIYRQWATLHGGVYVPITAQTTPNSYLARIPERDITTPSGRKLTLIHPAHMTRQLHELAEAHLGTRDRITSLKPIRPENAPDAWEKKTLQAFERGEKESSSLQGLGTETHMRFMRPLVTESGCLECHADQGYRVGDIQGGISVSVPWKPYQEALSVQIPGLLLRYGGVWALGILGLWVAINRAQVHLSGQRRAERARRASEENLSITLKCIGDGVISTDTEGRITRMNVVAETLTGCTLAEIAGLPLTEVFCIINVQTRQPVADQLARVIDTGHAVSLAHHTVLVARDGTERQITASAAPIFDSAGCIVGIVLVFHDVSGEYEAWEALRESEERYRTLVESSSDAIVVLDADRIIVSCNEGFSKLFGYTKEDIVGKPVLILHTSPQSYESFKEKTYPVIRETGSFRLEWEHAKKDGATFFAETVTSSMKDSGGRIIGYAGIIRDISDRKRAEEEIQRINADLERAIERANEMAVQAEQANAAKSEFLANMSHEIRTPMNGVIGMAGLLLDTELNPRQRQYAEVVRVSGEALLSLINDILDFSKMEVRKLELEILDFDLRATLEDTAEMLAVKANEKGLELTCLVVPEVPAFLRGDPGRFRQIIVNFAGNGVKFTHEGAVVIRASLDSEDEHSATVRVSVTDTGIGIPASRLGILFSPFTQVDGSTTRKYGGTGLGLAISKQLAEMMGGEIGVESTEGKGSTFWFTAVFEKRPEGQAPKHEVFSALEGVNVLVVDDHETNRLLVTTLLRSWGCRSKEAAGGDTALALLRDAARSGDPFEIAILDMAMPDMDGRELGRRIRASVELERTRLVMMTSLGQDGDTARLERMGFSGYLSKPIRQSKLRECLALAMARKARSDEVPAGGIVTLHTVAESVNRRIRILLAEDNIINQTVALAFLEKLGYRADVVANGQEVLHALERIPYDLVFMDCQMPEMDGFEATAVIRRPDSPVLNHDIPIIAMTAYAMKGDREKCIAAGMNDYLAKPIQAEKLAEALERWPTKVQRDDHVA